MSKPRIRFAYGLWRCFSTGESAFWEIAAGTSPCEAYGAWKAGKWLQ